jgi:hypothetical protein
VNDRPVAIKENPVKKGHFFNKAALAYYYSYVNFFLFTKVYKRKKIIGVNMTKLKKVKSFENFLRNHIMSFGIILLKNIFNMVFSIILKNHIFLNIFLIKNKKYLKLNILKLYEYFFKKNIFSKIYIY